MLRKIRVILFLAAMLLVFQANASADEVTQRTVRLDFDGQTTHILTTAATYEEALENYGIETHEKDLITPALSTKLVEGTPNKLKIVSGIDVTIVLDNDESFEMKIFANDKAGNILSEINDMYEEEYYYVDGYMNDTFSEGDTIYFVSPTMREFEVTEKLPYEEEIIYNDELDEGIENIIQEGEYGELTIITEVEYLGDEEVSREIVLEEVTKEPVNEIIEIGTKVEEEEELFVLSTPHGELEYEQAFVMEATAYSAKQPELSNYTASGRRAVYGVVAVDPNKIPLGTELYIEGYGKAIAADTGGAIKGNRIDLCYDSLQECYTFGRRPVTVYVLK